MANDRHVAMLKKGVDAWHAWRRANPNICPDLSGANLHGWILRTVALSKACHVAADLRFAVLNGAVFTGAICYRITVLSGARLVRARLGGVKLSGASVVEANLNRAILNRTVLRGARLV